MTARAAYDFAVAQHALMAMTYRDFWACMGQAMGRAPSTARTHAIAAGWPYRNADLGLVPVPRSKPAKSPRPKRCLCQTACRWVQTALSQLERQGDPRTETARVQLAATIRELDRLAAPRTNP